MGTIKHNVRFGRLKALICFCVLLLGCFVKQKGRQGAQYRCQQRMGWMVTIAG